MATASEWLEGARPRTFPAALSPVLAGTGVAMAGDGLVIWKAVLCLVVALALQVAVNYANDYSDGIRGTDADRVGPLRLVGSRAATPGQVKAAAFAAFGVAAVAGIVLALTSGWWLMLIGVVCIAAAWGYTGTSRPYGYAALGEVAVFVFFGLVAVTGTAYVQLGRLWWPAPVVACGVGALACAILVANNLRDIPTDEVAGKRTLAVVMGAPASRAFYCALVVIGFACLVPVAAGVTAWALLGLAGVPLAVKAGAVVVRGTTGLGLIPALRDTGLAELVYAAGLLIGLALA